MRYHITGAGRDTGDEVAIIIEAASQAEAAEKANRQGILVAGCTAHIEAQTPPVATADQDTKDCPFCGETIKAKAVKCRFCGERLDGAPAGATGGETAAEPSPKALKKCADSCLTMFVLFVVGLAAWVIRLVVYAAGGSLEGVTQAANLFVMAGVAIGVIFSLFYIPMCWRAIMRLPTNRKMMGLFGGFGLILLQLIELVLSSVIR